MPDDGYESPYRVRKRRYEPLPLYQRVIGYVIGITVGAALGGVGAGAYFGTGGRRSIGRADRVLSRTGEQVEMVAIVGAILGGLAGAVAARQAESRGGGL